MNRLKLSLCMIVRDSAATLRPCLASIAPWIDEMVIVDTGSRDTTKQIAAQFGARIYDFPWIDDFSAARNESLRLATGEWLFWMDADDVIDEDNGRRLRALVHGAHHEHLAGYVIQVHCPDSRAEGDITVVDHVKLFRNHPAIRFEHRIHEQVLMPIRLLGGEIAWTDLFVVHANADQSPDGRQRKYERDLRLLRLDLQDYPDHPFVLFNFGMTYNDMGEHATAIEWLQRSISLSEGVESHLRKAYALLVHSLNETGRTADALNVCRQALQYFPKDAELQFRLGMLLHQTNQFHEAVLAYQIVLRDGEDRHLSSRCQSITGYKARHNLALVHRDLGNHAAAEVQWRTILDEKPRYRAAWKSLGEVLLRQGKLVTAQVHGEQMLGQAEFRGHGLMFQAELAAVRGDKPQAMTLSQQAIQEFPDDIEFSQSRCRLLFESEAWDEAQQALTQLVERLPGDGAAWHNLGLARYRQENFTGAIAALHQSLAVRPESAVTHQLLNEVRSKMSSDLELPFCHSRRELDSGATLKKFFCANWKVHAPRNVVTPEICRHCTRWQEPPPAEFRPQPPKDWLLREGPCRFLGNQVALRDCPSCRGNVKVKVYACSHPAHETTTISDCLQCSDYQQKKE